MKQYLSLSILILTSSFLMAQSIPKRDVPGEVIKSYVSQNSKGVQDSIWSKQTITTYKVNFIDEGKRYEAQYFEDGTWIKTITEIPQVDLLPAIINQINTVYTGRKINKAFIELNPEGRFYTVDIGQGQERMTLYFLSSGKFAK